MDTSITALGNLVSDVSRITRDFSTELRKLHSIVQEIPSIKTAFIHARSYYIKVHSMADYICGEEQYTIKAVEEGNVEELKEYIREVSDKANNCKKDLQDFKDFFNTERQPLIDQTTKVVEHKREKAKMKTRIGVIAAVAGAIIFTLGIVLAAVPVPLGIRALGAVLIVVAVGSFATGTFFIIRGRTAKSLSQVMEQSCDHAVLDTQQMVTSITQMAKELETANNRLKSTLLQSSSVSHQPQSRTTTLQAIKEVTVEARGLKGYCQPLKNAATLNDFISYHAF